MLWQMSKRWKPVGILFSSSLKLSNTLILPETHRIAWVTQAIYVCTICRPSNHCVNKPLYEFSLMKTFVSFRCLGLPCESNAHHYELTLITAWVYCDLLNHADSCRPSQAFNMQTSQTGHKPALRIQDAAAADSSDKVEITLQIESNVHIEFINQINSIYLRMQFQKLSSLSNQFT